MDEIVAGARAHSVGESIGSRSVCVCVGSGGVGKTTLAAALALGMAVRGQRVALLTIDPARRLASALGLAGMHGEPHRVALDPQARGGQGELWAMTLDAKGTFDAMIRRVAADEQAGARILQNRIYRELSSAVAGTQELSALVKLHELHSEGSFDTIVLDTPPSRNALDFLDAPDRMLRFLDGRALGLFMGPGGMAARTFGRGGSLLMSIFSRATGVDLLADLSEFFRSMGSAIGGVRERAEGVSALLRDQSRSAFVIVTSPELGPSREAAFLAEHLQAAGMERSAVIVNRVNRLGLEGGTVEEVRARMGEALGERLARRVASNLADHDLRSRRDARNIAQLCAEIGEREPFLVDDLDHGVQDLAGLTRVAEQLF